MLLGIPKILPPERLKVLCEMGHGGRYEKTKKCYAIIAAGESALYANGMLQKGVV